MVKITRYNAAPDKVFFFQSKIGDRFLISPRKHMLCIPKERF